MSLSMHIQNLDKFYKSSQDIERKGNYDGQTNGWMDRMTRQPKSYKAPLFQSGAIIQSWAAMISCL